MEVTKRRARPAGVIQRPALLVLTGAMGLLALAVGPASAQDFSNNSPVTVALPGVPAGCPTPSGCPVEKANPYPSTIAVSGLSGTVSDVNVTVRDLTYPLKPADVDLMLVAPGGKAVMLMSDACGDNSTANENPINAAITLTFDDQASSQLPADGVCSTGSFRPVDDDDDAEEFGFHKQPDDTFTDAPVQAPAGTVGLSTFNGIDGNGTWDLYLVDDYPNDPNPNGTAGRIGGWTLSVNSSGTAAQTTATPIPPAQAPTITTAPPRSTATTVRATTPTTRATTATTRSSTTATTKVPLATSGRNSGPMAMVAAMLLAAGLAMVRGAGPAPQRRRRHRKSMVYIVHWH